MKSHIFIILFSFPIIILSQNDDRNIVIQNAEYAFSLNAPLFYENYGSEKGVFSFVSVEYIFNNKKYRKTSYSLIYGIEADKKLKYMENVFGVEISKILGSSNSLVWIELGGGMFYNRNLDIHPKIGGRMEIYKDLLFKATYTPRFLIEPTGESLFYGFVNHCFVISLGYSFRKR